MDLQTATIEEVQAYNANFKYDGSEARPFNLENVIHFIRDIRPTYQYVDEYSSGTWEELDIKSSHSKYGTNYIYIDHTRKLWRTRQTISEFYGPCGCYD